MLKCFSFLGTLTSKPATGGLPVDATGGLPSSGPSTSDPPPPTSKTIKCSSAAVWNCNQETDKTTDTTHNWTDVDISDDSMSTQTTTDTQCWQPSVSACLSINQSISSHCRVRQWLNVSWQTLCQLLSSHTLSGYVVTWRDGHV